MSCQKIRKSATKHTFNKFKKISCKPDRHYGNAEPLDGIRPIDDTEFVKDMELFLK